MLDNGPSWFSKYISESASDHFVRVHGCEIHYQMWGSNDEKPGLLFIHGNGAHAHWWDFIAPAFKDDFRVAAIDLSGAGDSEHRTSYSAEIFSDEILAVCSDAGLNTPALIGHSFGGSMARTCAYLHPNDFSALIVIDSAISNHQGSRPIPRMPRSEVRYYKSLKEATRRFRLRPPQPCDNQYIIDYIAEHSVRKANEGYRFKLDQALFAKMKPMNLPDAFSMVSSTSCPVGIIYGELSRFFGEDAVQTLEQLVASNRIIRIERAYHHVFLDRPEEFTQALRQLANSFLPTDSLIYSP
ncbi:MAG TPA: alpha/beta hydrolase [Gammaproteobacteria bacterium]|nr:alpha/beta hydrolase [Gammaproteobacteria bacterium]